MTRLAKHALLTTVFGLVVSGVVQADGGDGRAIVGAWRTVVTLYNCQTGNPTAPPFPGLITFNDGGTMSEWGLRQGQNPALRSPGHGVWQREHDWQNYSFAVMFYRYDANGVFLGPQRI